MSFVLLMGGLIACDSPLTQDPVFDFILKLPEANRDFDSFSVDLSDPNHFQYLRSGWHIPGQDNIPVTQFVWSSNVISTVNLNVKVSEDKELLLAVRPYHYEGVPPVSLNISLNDHQIGKIQLKDEWRSYRLLVPAQFIQPGENVLTITQSMVFKPSEVMFFSEDERALGACYSYIVLRSQQEPQPPGMYTLPQVLGARNFVWGGKQRHVLFDNAPSRFSWSLRLPSKPVVSFGVGFLPDEYSLKGPDAKFEIVLTDQAQKQHRLFQTSVKPPRRLLEMGWKEFSRDLRSFSGQSVTITFLTESDVGSDGLAGNGSWLEPMIWNRHVNYNLIFLPIADGFDSDNIPAGSGLEKFVSKSRQTQALEPGKALSNDIAGIPADFLDLIISEGWPVGYFFTGRNVFEQDKVAAGRFDRLSGFDTSNSENIELLINDCSDWIKALENRKFCMIFEPADLSNAAEDVTDSALQILDWLSRYSYDQDSLIIVYSPGNKRSAWVINPNDSSRDSLEVDSWPHLLNQLTESFLKIAR